MDSVLQDLRLAARQIARNPGFAALAILTLALGIGANTAIFTALDALLLRPLPYPEPERLVSVSQTDPGRLSGAVAPGNFADWRELARSFEGLAALEVVGRTHVGGDEPARLQVAIVSGNLFEVLGVKPALGRSFGPLEAGPREAVLGHALWQSRFGADPGIAGRAIDLEGEPLRIVGVMPAGFAFPREADLWLRARRDLPELGFLPHDFDLRSLRDARYLEVVGRLRPGVRRQAAQVEMDLLGERLARAYPDANRGNGIRLTALVEEQRGGARSALGLLLGAVLLVLAIACANVANLLLARASGRRRELAVRVTLGAARGRLARQLLTEAAALVVLGGGLGLVLARASLPLLLALWPASLPPLEDLQLSLPVLASTTAVALIVTLAVGGLPAHQASQQDALASLRGAARAARGSRGDHRARGLLVTFELGLAVVLVAGASLLLHSLWRLQSAPLGFEPRGVLTAKLSLPQALADDAPATRALYHELEQRLLALPGVSSVGIGMALPLSQRSVSAGLRVHGRVLAPNERPDVSWRLVTASFFRTLGIPLLRGRAFTGEDRAGSPPVALVNATLARLVFRGEDPVGRRIGTGLDGDDAWVTVAGVVGDTPQAGPAIPVRPEMYRPFDQDTRFPSAWVHLAVRTPGDPVALTSAIRTALAEVRKDVVVSDIRPLTKLGHDSIAGPRAAGQALCLFALLALLLAAVGVYGVVSCLVGERLHELGVRLALGARPAEVVALVLRSSARLAAGGLGAGLLAALALGRLLEGFLYGVTARDPASLGVVVVALLATTLAAAILPARRAARLDPAAVLRSE